MILRYLGRKDWAALAVCVLLIAIQVYLDLEIPGYMASITTALNTGGTSADVLAEGLPMLGCAFGSLACSMSVGFMTAYLASSFSKTLRKKQFEAVQGYSLAEMGRFSIASLITRSTNDVSQVQSVVAIGLQVVVKAPIMASGAVVKIIGSDLKWTSAVAVSVVLIMCVIVLVMRFVVPRFKRIQILNDGVNRVTKEGIEGIRVVHAYNAEDYQQRRFKNVNGELVDTHLTVSRAMAFMHPTMSTIMNLMSLSIYWIGASIVNAATGMMRVDEFSSMVVFSAYAMQVVSAFMMTTAVFTVIPRAQVSARRIEEVIETDPSIKDGNLEKSPDGFEGEIEFRDVGFRYPDTNEYVFRNVSFKISKGETVAFIGPTGCGKTTLVNLIPRFYDATEGQILVDGVDVREYTLEALRRKIGYVPQKSILMAGTVESNVNYGDTSSDRTMDDVRKALDIAQATDFVEAMDGGVQGHVAEKGGNLSGGQKQRVSIARAVCRRPEIYIFDDSFSALDYRTDRTLRTALKKETAGVTSIIVAQRIGTIMDADKIIVIDEGRAVGIGRHEDLLRGCSAYKDIAASQLAPEEVGS
ncbi:MAG: ABC transporter ATP-binding protein [Candidatus Methanomethylophilaceae archaeon]|jgi:ATP-binding cassette subfamily B protein|nr:ABC transporter ATP-binding protein [Candidatus Methanomethylophilaceae archaeon]